MEFLDFRIIGTIVSVLLIAGSQLIFWSKKKSQNSIGEVLTILGIAFLVVFIILLWNHLHRPPLRTLGETRLWYAFFVSSVGFIVYKRWKYNWFPIISSLYTTMFILMNVFQPENFDKTLMPALQSPWFVPHVVVYILAYSILGVSMLVAMYCLYTYYKKTFKKEDLNMADNLVYIGFALLTCGLLFGAMWAKEAWGHYWSWDPKETWAFITWLGYLLYVHFRRHKPNNIIVPLWILSIAFVLLLVAWYGVNYLPSAQSSVHVYSQQ